MAILISSTLSSSNLIYVFPLFSISSSDHHFLVSTHPQSNTVTVAPLVPFHNLELRPPLCGLHSPAIEHRNRLAVFVTSKLSTDSTCFKSSFSGAFLLHNCHHRLGHLIGSHPIFSASLQISSSSRTRFVSSLKRLSLKPRFRVLDTFFMESSILEEDR
ncbi:Uncharacterized protein Rs2_28726 [Raphanus sativus]|nr:Uncharacterized protein Rs2_28726 [Raphanus sativus]